MELHFYGHAAVGLHAEDGSRLIVDPYRSGGLGGAMRYRPIETAYDWGVASHDHDDHAGFDQLPEPPQVVDCGEYGPFRIDRFPFAHDEYDGQRFGGLVDILRIECDGVTVVHGSDVGQSPAGPLPDALRRPDVALLPTGGFYTLGPAQAWEWAERLGPDIVIPTHYATERCDLPLQPVDHLLARARRVVQIADGCVELSAGLPRFSDSSVVVIESRS